uniref:Uncharacterized protein n=1 Tax=Aegilops tauschii subsp. strangulata TaxID=200361 RepID=A0A453JWX4_AEGTS
EHDCGVHRGIGYFIEPLILLGLFGRSPLSIRLKEESRMIQRILLWILSGWLRCICSSILVFLLRDW